MTRRWLYAAGLGLIGVPLVAFGSSTVYSIARVLFVDGYDSSGISVARAVLSVPMLIYGGQLLHRARRYLAFTSGELLRLDTRQHIVYLRPFIEDHKRREVFDILSFGKTIEELVLDAFVKLGPVVTIGRPGEALPPVGAAREYVEDHVWQQRVVDLVTDSQWVVMLAGKSRGLMWELQALSRLNILTKLLLIMPAKRAERAGAWPSIRSILEEAGVRNLPPDHEVVGRGLVLMVDNDGSAVLFGGAMVFPSSNYYAMSYRYALEQFTKRVSAPGPGGAPPSRGYTIGVRLGRSWRMRFRKR